jgi:hypothetical protein
MKKVIFSTVSAFVFASAAIPAFTPSAEAQMTMHFSSPFISNSGLVGAAGDRHFITVAVTGFPLESLTIALPNDLRQLDGAMVLDENDQEISAKVAINKGSVTLTFPQPIEPDNYLTVRLSGVRMDSAGGTALYRVTATYQGLPGTLPIGTAMVRLRSQN